MSKEYYFIICGKGIQMDAYSHPDIIKRGGVGALQRAKELLSLEYPDLKSKIMNAKGDGKTAHRYN